MAFRDRHAGKARKDAHPARAGAAILASVLPHASHPAEGSKTDQATLGAGRCSLPAKDAHGKVCKGEADIECAEGLLYPHELCQYFGRRISILNATGWPAECKRGTLRKATMLVVKVNVESRKECATTSISSLQERDCIAELRGTREGQSPISRQRSARIAPASATSSRGMAATDALGHVLPKRKADERRRRYRAKRRLSDPALTQKVRLLIMDRHWSLEQIDNISGSRVAAGAS
ncbi:MAG: hypothetical protein DUD39_16445 [Coriobacteriaceae bacterium]|nr:MAG: hypothetical protein DUD39_16445 [Coriobacteriaceae bacterium]